MNRRFVLLLFSRAEGGSAPTTGPIEDRASGARRPVSRVLYPPQWWRAMTIPLGRPLPDASRDRPGRRRGKPAWPGAGPAVSSLFGLAPGGVCRAVAVAGNAVRSYRTLSPLPAGRAPAVHGRRSAFCGTVPGVAPAGCYPAPCFPWSPDFPPPPCPLRARVRAAIRPSGTTFKVRWRAPARQGRRAVPSGQPPAAPSRSRCGR